MRIQLVAIDLDGTLLNSSKQITDTSAAIIRTARRDVGTHIVLASARPPRSVMPFYDLLELEAPMINYNGALVYDPLSHRVILHKPIPAENVRGLVMLARSIYPGVLVSAEVMDEWYTDRLDMAYATETARHCKPDVIAPVDEWFNQQMTKLLLLGEPQRLAEVANAILDKFEHQVVVMQTEGTHFQSMRRSPRLRRCVRSPTRCTSAASM